MVICQDANDEQKEYIDRLQTILIDTNIPEESKSVVREHLKGVKNMLSITPTPLTALNKRRLFN